MYTQDTTKKAADAAHDMADSARDSAKDAVQATRRVANEALDKAEEGVKRVKEEIDHGIARQILFRKHALGKEEAVFVDAVPGRFFAQIGCWPAVGVTFMPLRLGCHRAGTCPCIAGPATSVR